ncbi:MAG: hypothetical protein ACFFDT_27130 [Candidatus Hodarchaeota archaeon]
MEKIRQVIVRDTPEKGLDVVATTLQESQTQNISLFIPEEELSGFNEVFLTKFPHPSGNIILRFTFDAGRDHFGRQSIKTHTLIINNSFYNEKTAQYFVSPLINGSMNIEDNNLLKLNDFETLDPYPISSKLIELIFSKKQVQLISQKRIDPLTLIQIFGAIDRIIPPPLNPTFSFQTMVSPSHKNTLKKHSLVYSLEELPHSQPLDQIQSKESKFPSIQAISNSISDLSLLRELQKQLFLGIPERWLSLRLQWRFGIKRFSHIRENLNTYF